MTPDEITQLRTWLDASEGLADGRAFLDDRRLDAMTEVLLELAAQIWVVKRRNAVLEDLLDQKGIIAPPEVEEHSLSAPRAADLRAQRSEFVATVFRSLNELPQTPQPSATAAS